jgi:hypothetical protein
MNERERAMATLAEENRALPGQSKKSCCVQVSYCCCGNIKGYCQDILSFARHICSYCTDANVRKSYNDNAKEFIFLTWDGMGFFGHDGNKIDRMKNKPVSWKDPFFNRRWLLFKAIFVFLLIRVTLSQYSKLGDVKS